MTPSVSTTSEIETDSYNKTKGISVLSLLLTVKSRPHNLRRISITKTIGLKMKANLNYMYY